MYINYKKIIKTFIKKMDLLEVLKISLLHFLNVSIA